MDIDLPMNVTNLTVDFESNREFSPSSPQKLGDVGYDLYVSVRKQDMTWFERTLHTVAQFFNPKLVRRFRIVWPWSSAMLHSGVHLGLPEWIWARIEARSSTSRKRMVVLGGIIDSGYRGEYFTVLGNFSMIPRIVFHGERYAQVVFYLAIRPRLSFTHRLQQSSRGASGFGSTGA